MKKLVDPWLVLALLVVARPSLAQTSLRITEHAYLLPTGIGPDQQFGRGVDLDGASLIVGSSTDDHGGTNSGSAYVFESSGLGWIQQQELVPTPSNAFAWAGTAVSIAGDLAVVGAPKHWAGAGGGAAFVFERAGGVWSQTAILSPASLPDDWAYFGSSVVATADRVYVGAPETGNFDPTSHHRGSVYVFVRTGSSWTLEQRLRAADDLTHSGFGWSISVSGDTLLVGAPNARVAGTGSVGPGAAYVYTRTSGSGWVEQAKLSAPVPVPAETFGFGVALDGDVALIGVPLRYFGAIYAVGGVEIFRRVAGAWSHEARIEPRTAFQYQCFGRTVSLAGERAVVSAPACWPGTAVPTGECNAVAEGAVLVLERRNGLWGEMARIEASNESTVDDLGSALLIDGDRVVLGAPMRAQFGFRSGGVYSLDLSQRFETHCVAAPNSVGAGALISAVGSLSVAANDFTLRCTGLPTGSFGKFYYGPVRAQTPFGNGYRCVGGASYRLYPILSADASGSVSRWFDVTQGPAGSGSGQVLAGTTWNFQYWYRNAAAGGAGFNLSDAFSATFMP